MYQGVKKMKYLITGIAGFVGASLAYAILERNPKAIITGVDNFSYGYRDRLSAFLHKINFIEGDVNEIETFVGRQKFDVIIHCAAIAPLPECQIDSYRAINQNVSVVGALIDYALKSGSRDIIFFSSGAIYEGVNEFPTSENVPIKTSLVYPTSKYIAEIYLEAMCRSHEINVTSLRLFNLYGPRQDYFRKQPPLIGYLISCLLNESRAILFSDGNQRRDYVYIDDLLELINLSAEKMNKLKNGGRYTAINVGSGNAVSVNNIIDILENISGKKLMVDRLPSAKYWDKYQNLFNSAIPLKKSNIENEVNKFTQASVVKVKNEFGWSCGTNLDTGLEKCYEYAKNIIFRKI